MWIAKEFTNSARKFIAGKPKYTPLISEKLYRLSNHISNKFKNITHCVWDTDWLNEFSRHQTTHSQIITEIEKDFVESLYYELRDNFNNDIFINPDDKEIEFYIAESEHPVIVKKLITRSPISTGERKRGGSFPLVEKILVDIFTEEKLFHYLPGSELSNIYESAIQKYQINFSTLLNYANRRGKDIVIRQYLKNHIPRHLNEVI